MIERSETDLERTVPRLLGQFSASDLQAAVPVIIVFGLKEGTIQYDHLTEEQKLLLGLFVTSARLEGDISNDALASALEAYLAAFPNLRVLIPKLFELARAAAAGGGTAGHEQLERLLGNSVARVLVRDAEVPEGSARGQLVRMMQIDEASKPQVKKTAQRRNPLVFDKGE